MQLPLIAGIDEAGRGALAGPVVAGACILLHPVYPRQRAVPRWSPFEQKRPEDCPIADSKSLTPEEREETFAWIVANCAFGVGIVSQEVIDTIGILKANLQAMHLALAQLCRMLEPSQLLIDGNDKYAFPIPHRSIIRGDQSEPCIAAASILAKVTRDRFMREQSDAFPAYGFATHKGYGAAEHIAAIRAHGPCVLHRKTFLSRILNEQQSLLLA